MPLIIEQPRATVRRFWFGLATLAAFFIAGDLLAVLRYGWGYRGLIAISLVEMVLFSGAVWISTWVDRRIAVQQSGISATRIVGWTVHIEWKDVKAVRAFSVAGFGKTTRMVRIFGPQTAMTATSDMQNFGHLEERLRIFVPEKFCGAGPWERLIFRARD